MKIQLLPSNIPEPGRLQPLTSYLVNDALAIDGGSLGFALNLEGQRRVNNVVVTHTHSDHIASLPILVAEIFPHLTEPVGIYSTAESIASLRAHVFNDRIWPAFDRIKLLNGNGFGIRYVEIRHLEPFECNNLRITPAWTNHTVPTVGLSLEDGDAAVLITSDTYHTDEIWRLGNRLEHLRAIFVDVSYPNEMEKLAADSKHLTPQALEIELGKLTRSAKIYPVHLKPQFREQIVKQLTALGRKDVVTGEIGREYVF